MDSGACTIVPRGAPSPSFVLLSARPRDIARGELAAAGAKIAGRERDMRATERAPVAATRVSYSAAVLSLSVPPNDAIRPRRPRRYSATGMPLMRHIAYRAGRMRYKND